MDQPTGRTVNKRGFTTAERIWDRVERDESGCWLWTGPVGRGGYSKFTVWDKTVGKTLTYLVHRWMWEHFNGPIPEGLQIDHLCRVRRCVNPLHLEPVTPQENQLRAVPFNRRTHCKRGHELTTENTRLDPRQTQPERGFSMACRTCERARNRARYHRLKAQRAA